MYFNIMLHLGINPGTSRLIDAIPTNLGGLQIDNFMAIQNIYI